MERFLWPWYTYHYTDRRRRGNFLPSAPRARAMLIGHGFDLHRLAAGRALILGGVPVRHAMGLLAHSDGDVVLHALVDALLGAAGLPDLGELFPDSDPANRNRPGADFIAAALEALAGKGLRPVQADVTILLEEPRLGEAKTTIRESVARLLRLAPDKVGVKAKTMEGLGAVGEGRAAAAFAVALVEEIPKRPPP